ncbi:rpsU-divergently transcribed protein, partial [marine sediment metagenome]
MTNTDRDALLDAALVHVPFEGMNERALAAGARDIGMDAALIRVISRRAAPDWPPPITAAPDRALREALAATPLEGRFRDRVAQAVWQRLELSDPE